jgi:hypothetical protein
MFHYLDEHKMLYDLLTGVESAIPSLLKQCYRYFIAFVGTKTAAFPSKKHQITAAFFSVAQAIQVLFY